MLRSLPSAIDNALDTLYEPNAVFSQFLGSASSMTFFSFPFYTSSFLVLSSLAFLAFFFPFLSRFFAFLNFLFFPFIHLIFFSLMFFFQLTCVVRAYA